VSVCVYQGSPDMRHSLVCTVRHRSSDFVMYGVFNKRVFDEQIMRVKNGRVSGGLLGRFQTPFFEHSIMQP
jgi:hypothetical protein